MLRIEPALIALLFTGCAATPQDATEARDGLEATFHGRVLAVDEGEVVFDEWFGVPEVVIATEGVSTLLFRIGSVTKTFTAAAIALLHEDGKLDIDGPLSDHLPGFPNADAITIRMLLEHRSGVADFAQYDFSRYMYEPISSEEMVALLEKRPPAFEPGRKQVYNNAGYAILGYIIESVSGMTYPEFLRRRLLDPLDMRDTGFAPVDADVSGLVRGFGPGMKKDYTEYNYEMIMATGGLYSTAEDLAKFCTAFDGPDPLPAWYIEDPLGWNTGVRFGRPAQWQTGNTNTYSALLAKFRDGPSYYIVLSNEGRVGMHPAIKPLGATLFETAP